MSDIKNKKSNNEEEDKVKEVTYKYELLPPEGGWGYVVTIATAAIFIVTVVPLTAFGVTYGNFLANIGDETSGTALVNALFGTVQNFTGLAASHLLKKMSCRAVGFIGAGLFFLGICTTIFVKSLPQFLFSFGVLEGLGFGLLMPAAFTSFNSYFDKKKNLMMGLCQALMVLVTILIPPLMQYIRSTYGFQGTIALLGALSLNAFAGVAALQPVEWHMVKKLVNPENKVVPQLLKEEKRVSLRDEVLTKQIEPLLLDKNVETGSINSKYIRQKPRQSIISMESRSMSVTTIDKNGLSENEETKLFLNFLDLSLFTDLKYLNISIGLALGFFTDITFISLLAVLLKESGMNEDQVTYIITMHFAIDFVARVIISFASTILPIKNRTWFLGACILSAIVRTVFLMGDTFLWKLVTVGILGFLRTFIQTPLPLVIAEEYNDNFATAFSLYMVVGGIINLVFGVFASYVKEVTNDNDMVVHLLTSAFVLCAVSWSIELMYTKVKKQKK